ncbi:MAG: hypothetical protein A2X58_06825 [Nitrospirae bacterium GWC2_56_14]|nr:MAG: hypothetical protein A2X58_06825 [Nitrospirae bacterium GWC2_56_14]
MNEITILHLKGTLIAPIQVELHDKAALNLQEEILRRIEQREATGLIIDISAISIVDSFMARLLADTAKSARLMGVETVLVGMRKEVVITLIQLGMSLSGVETALNMEEGMELLDQLREKAAWADDSGAH